MIHLFEVLQGYVEWLCCQLLPSSSVLNWNVHPNSGSGSALILVPRMSHLKCFHSVKKGWMHESLACHSVEKILQRLTPTVGTLHSSWCPNWNPKQRRCADLRGLWQDPWKVGRDISQGTRRKCWNFRFFSTLPKFNSSPLKAYLNPNRKGSFPPATTHFFRGKLDRSGKLISCDWRLTFIRIFLIDPPSICEILHQLVGVGTYDSTSPDM